MPTHQQTAKEDGRALRLQQAAKEAFGRLYPTERNLLDKAARSHGELAFASTDKDEDNDAVNDGKEWNRSREIRSELLRWLCVDEVARKQVDPHGLNAKGARITGQLDLSHVAVPFPLQLQQCYFEEPLNLFQSEMPGLILTGRRVPGINAGSARIKGHVALDEGFRCDGEVTLSSVHIGGDLQCSGGTFCNPYRNDPKTDKWDPNSGTALNADGANIDGFVLLRLEDQSERTFQSEGEVRFVGAQIQGDLDCERGRFSNLPLRAFAKSGVALNADRLTTKGGVFLRNGFNAKGSVAMRDAQVGSSLDCEGGRFTNPFQEEDKIGGDALVLDRAAVKGSVFLRSPALTGNVQKARFSAEGNVSVIAVFVGGQLDLQDGDFRKASLDLTSASAASVIDSGKKSWPKRNNLYLRRFQYGHIAPENAKERLLWLALQPYDDFNTDSYVQLAKVLQQSGDDDGARIILQTASELEARHGHPYWYLRPDNLFAASIGYGYRPIWAVGYISLMSAVGWIIYRRSYLAGTIAPTDKDAYNDVKSKHSLPPHYPRFAPLIFSLENSLPLVKLGQADKWQPDAELSSHVTDASPKREIPWRPSLNDGALPGGASGSSEVVAPELGKSGQASAANAIERPRVLASLAPHESNVEHLPPMFTAVRRMVGKILYDAGLQTDAKGHAATTPPSHFGTSPTFLKWCIWVHILLGWLFATLFVAGISGIVRKQ